MRTALLLAALVAAVPARAQVRLLDAPGLGPSAGLLPTGRGLLSAAEGQNPVRDTKASLFLVGLGLVGAGLVLGGAGFAILYVCREGQQCHSDRTLQTAGWVLAAPGVIPLAVGLLLVYISSGGRGRGAAPAMHRATPLSWGLMPLPGAGAIATGAFRF